MKSHHIVNFIIYLLLFAPFSLFLQVKSHPPITGKFKKWRTFCFLLQNKTICEFEKTTATLITKRLPNSPLISIRCRFPRRRPPFSPSGDKPNNKNQNRPSYFGLVRRCQSTKSATKGAKCEISDMTSTLVRRLPIRQPISIELVSEIINSIPSLNEQDTLCHSMTLNDRHKRWWIRTLSVDDLDP